MRLPCVRSTLRQVMAGIAVSAIFLALLRETNGLIVLACPIAGAVLEIRKGGSGIFGGWVGGAFTALSPGIVLASWAYIEGRLPYVGPAECLVLGLFAAAGGAVLGVIEGVLAWHVAMAMMLLR